MGIKTFESVAKTQFLNAEINQNHKILQFKFFNTFNIIKICSDWCLTSSEGQVRRNQLNYLVTVSRYIFYQLGNPAWSGGVIISPTFYPPLGVNYDFGQTFSLKVDPLNLESQNQAKNIFCGFPELPNQNLRQIGPRVPEL